MGWSWLAAGTHQATLIPLPEQDRVENKMEKLMGEDKDREIVYQLLSYFGKIKL